MPSKTFARFKWAEEFAHGLDSDDIKFTLRNELNVVHIEPGEEDEPYVYTDYIVEWEDS